MAKRGRTQTAALTETDHLEAMDRAEKAEAAQLLKKLSRGQEIRLHRQSRRWNQAELARRAGVNKETIVRIERGENVRMDTLERVRDVLIEKPKIDVDMLHRGYTSREHDIVSALYELPEAAKDALHAVLTRKEFDADAATLLEDWSLLTSEERSAFRMLIAGRVEDRKQKPHKTGT